MHRRQEVQLHRQRSHPVFWRRSHRHSVDETSRALSNSSGSPHGAYVAASGVLLPYGLSGGQGRGRCSGGAQWKILHFVGPRDFGVLIGGFLFLRRLGTASTFLAAPSCEQGLRYIIDRGSVARVFFVVRIHALEVLAGWTSLIVLYVVARRLDSIRILRHRSKTSVCRGSAEAHCCIGLSSHDCAAPAPGVDCASPVCICVFVRVFSLFVFPVASQAFRELRVYRLLQLVDLG